MPLNQYPLAAAGGIPDPFTTTAANDEHVLAAISPRAWGKRHATVTRRIGDLLVSINDRHTVGHSPARQVACAELGDLLASFAIDYLRDVANDAHHTDPTQ